jgi:ABC-2 type transport system permease protein
LAYVVNGSCNKKAKGSGKIMVSTLISLKLRMMRNSMFGSKLRAVSSLVFLIGSLGFAVVGAARLAARADAPWAIRRESIIIGLMVLFGLWVFGPLLVGGVDDALDPQKLALLPLERRDLQRGLMAGALVGPLPVATTVALIGISVGYTTSFVGGLLVAFAATSALFFNLACSRALAVGLAFASRSRRGKDLSVLLAALCAALLFLGTQSVRFMRDEQKASVLKAMRWLPPGQIATAILEAQAGTFVPALLRLVLLSVLTFVLVRAWMKGIDRLLVDNDSARHGRMRTNVGPLDLLPRSLQRFSQRPTVVLFAKELRYLVRSPQRRSSMIISIVIGTVFALLQSLRYNSSNPLAVFGAPIAALFGVHSTNNLLGTDAASLWMEQTAGVKVKQQLIARGLAALPNLVVPTVLAAGVLAIMTNGWREFLIVTVISCTCWGVALGIGSVISVIAPFNQPDVGNPHSNNRSNTGQGGLVSIMAVVGVGGLGALFMPIAAIVGAAYLFGSFFFVSVATAVSTVYALIVWRLGIALAMRIRRGRHLDLLADLGGRRALT